MPFKTVDSKEQVPDGATAFETRDGKFVYEEPENIDGLKSALEKERAAAKAAKKAQQELEARLAALEDEKKAKAAGISDEQLARMRADLEAQTKPLKEQLEALQRENRTLKLDTKVKGLLAQAEVVDVDAAWRLLADQFDLTEEGSAVVKANPTADLTKFVTEDVKKQMPWLFRGTAAGGSGAGNAGGGVGGGAKAPTQMSSDERAAFIKDKGYDAYRQALDAELAQKLTAKSAA